MLRMPQMVPLFSGNYIKGEDGKVVPEMKLLQFGFDIEEDPKRKGYARYSHEYGSICRSGKGYVALGLATADTPVVVPAAVAGPPFVPGNIEVNYTDAIRESGWLGTHVIHGIPAAPTLSVSDIRYRNDGLTSGNVPLNMFDAFSFYSPLFGHFIRENVSLTESFRNFALADQNLIPGFTLL